ncbi:MAG: hypothetical protein IPK19_35060 [Chloroflexi bacterium]|nr:hypothetical protein [Chloroflexota bacterium]
MESHGHPSRQPIPFGLALTAGAGLVLMLTALGLGVANAEIANGGLIGFLFVAGLLLLITGIGIWTAVVRPFDHFDDINQPKDTGHGHGHDAPVPASEELLLPEGMQGSLEAGEAHSALPAGTGHAH